jgi:GNAT superfamily N-acetyltransferase
MDSVVIREARAEDQPAVRVLTLSAYDEYETTMEPSAWAGLQHAVQAALDHGGAMAHFVADQGGEVVGSVLLFAAAGADTQSSGGRMIWPELRLLAVAATVRGQGVGKRLVQACIERARAAGQPVLGLYTSQSMRPAIAIYEGLGFTRVPAYDFQPPGAEVITAYKLDL